MNLAHKMDVPTLQFIIRLKAINHYWYMTLIRCAQKDVKTTEDCIKEAVKHLNYALLTAKDVNAFQITYAVNQGLLTDDSFKGTISTSPWELRLTQAIKDLNNNGDLK